jgi:CHAT domain-containing protein/tetratricopeptide (TPR) repeat protein
MPRTAPFICTWAASLLLFTVTAPGQSPSPPAVTVESDSEALIREATQLMRQLDLLRAEELFGRALAAREDSAGESLAPILIRLAEVAVLRGKMDQAQTHLDRAFTLLAASTPESVEMADALSVKSMLARRRDDLDEAQALLDRAFALLEPTAPQSVEMAEVLNKLGLVARDRFELDRAQDYFRRALAIYERGRPGGIEIVHSLHNLGQVAEYRGDLAAAEPLYRRALLLAETIAPNSMAVAYELNNLGTVANTRGDLASAESYGRRSVALCEARAPDSLELATTLANLGGVLRRRGELKSAERLLRRALAIRERVAPPNGLVVALSLRQLGIVLRDRGDRAQAEALIRRALAIEARVRPDSLRVAMCLRELGEATLARGRWDEAEQHLARGLAIVERLHPGSLTEAQLRNAHGRLFKQRGRLRDAADEMRRAVDALELQIGMVGGLGEDRAGYRARRSTYYADLVDVLLRLGEAPEAFHVLERSRARGFLEMMAAHDLAAKEPIPSVLEADRRRLAGQYDQVQRRLARHDGGSASAAVSAVQEELRQLRRRHGEIMEEIRRGSAGQSLRYPRPFDLAATKAALEPGTLLLSYAVGDEQTHVFAVSREDGLTVETLSVGRAALQRDVDLFRRLIQQAAPASPRTAQLADVGRRLYQRLIARMEPHLERCRRVLIAPDGPLHVLPFAALVHERKGAGRYLVEWKPIWITLSATVYGELRQRRSRDTVPDGTGAAPALVAFGDPVLPTSGVRDDDTTDRERSLLREVAGLRPLPAARDEVDRIATLFPGRAEVLLGARATEDRVKEIAHVRYLHFATHAVLDDASPMDTALVLAAPASPGERDNGLLQAWEVEQLRLNVELVVLSACDSGLGREQRGEGLWGLTRAFHHAGAPSVVASLWRVSDQATAALMVRFYDHLREGRAKDEALRAAQMDLIAGRVREADRPKTARPDSRPSAGRVRGADGPKRARPGSLRPSDTRVAQRNISTPYHWAAFQLYGDER